MKILQTSGFFLGRHFEDNCAAGNKLRAGIKTIFSSVIDVAKDEKADLVIFAGDIFDNLDLSHNMLDFFVSEVIRLENTPAILFPGNKDRYEQGSFWDYWKVALPSANLRILAGKKPAFQDIPDLSMTVYGIPVGPGQTAEGQIEFLKKSRSSKYHLAITNVPVSVKADYNTGDSFDLKPFASFGYNYVAVCGDDNFKEYGDSVIKAYSSGSPLGLSEEKADSGGVLILKMEGESVSVELKKTQGFKWHTVDIPMDTIHNIEDLKKRILEFSGQNTLLKVRLTGLTLLETGLNTEQLQSDLEEHFLDIRFEDKTRVLPQNISEVKVQEKSTLGQYFKVMVDRLNQASGAEKEKYEKSLKIGYTLLSGREVW